MSEINYKEVDYKSYCKTCKHKSVDEFKEPCNECLTYSVLPYTRKPMHYENGGDKIGRSEQQARSSRTETSS